MATNSLRSVVAPRLPSSPEPPDKLYLEQLNNVLRLYFNQLDTAVGALINTQGGAYLNHPYGAFSSYASQALPVVNTGVIIKMTQTDFNNGVTLNSASAAFTASMSGTTLTVTAVASGAIKINMTVVDSGVTTGTRIISQTSGVTGGIGIYVISIAQTLTSRAMVGEEANMLVDNSGIYNMQFSVQVQNLSNAPQDVYFWLKQNGADIVGSTGVIGMPARKNPGDPAHDIKGWNYFLSMNAGDYVEIWWSTTDLSVTLPTYIASVLPTKPSTASVVATMSFVSTLPA